MRAKEIAYTLTHVLEEYGFPYVGITLHIDAFYPFIGLYDFNRELTALILCTDQFNDSNVGHYATMYREAEERAQADFQGEVVCHIAQPNPDGDGFIITDWDGPLELPQGKETTQHMTIKNNNPRSVCDKTGSHKDRPYEWIQGGACLICGKPFTGLHLASKQTCSPKCRKQLQRDRAEIEQAFTLAMSELQKLRRTIKRRERVPVTIEELQRLKGEVNDLLLLAGDPDAIARNQLLNDRAR